MESKAHGAQDARQIWVSQEIHAAIAEMAHANHRKIRMESEVQLCSALGFSNLDELNAKYTPDYMQDLRKRGILKTETSPAKKSSKTS